MHSRRLALAATLVILLAVSCDSLVAAYSVLLNWGQNAPPLVALALAAAIVLSCGQLDIASGAVFSLCGMTLILWANSLPESMLLGVACVVLLTACIYGLIAALVLYLRVPALLCTLAVGFCAKASSVLIYTYLKGVGLFSRAGHVVEHRLTLRVDQMLDLFSNGILNLIWILLIVGALWAWRYRSDWGIKHIAVGMNKAAARLAGIRTESIIARAFLVASLLIAFGALSFLFETSQGGWSPDIGWNRELAAIAAAVIGGTRINGGRFDPISTSLAAVLIFALRDVVDSYGWPPDYSLLLMGLALLLVGVGDEGILQGARWLRARRR